LTEGLAFKPPVMATPPPFVIAFEDRSILHKVFVNANGTAKPDSHTTIDAYVNEMDLKSKYLV
jgi:hypothetical protein